MEALKRARKKVGLSQRTLARRAGLSFKGVQLMEEPGHDMRLSSLSRYASAVGLPPSGPRRVLERFLAAHPDSVEAASYRILDDGFESWQIHLFDLVDALRAGGTFHLIRNPPAPELWEKPLGIMTSTVEHMCVDLGLARPRWCSAVASLDEPWFVSCMESLKAMALLHSPPEFRKRNIFVLENFLERV